MVCETPNAESTSPPCVRRHNPYPTPQTAGPPQGRLTRQLSAYMGGSLEQSIDDDDGVGILSSPKSVTHHSTTPRQDYSAAAIQRRGDASIQHQTPTKEESGDSAFVSAKQLEQLLAAAPGPVDQPCPGGLVFDVYTGDIAQHYRIPSVFVQITRGAIKYVDHHAKYGQHMRFRFQLCHNYLTGKCTRLSECSYIHATSLPQHSEVHLNPYAPRRSERRHAAEKASATHDDPAVADAYQTFPPGFMIRVFPPNDAGVTEPQMIPSDKIIVTAGAVTARRWHNGDTAVAKPRHCAHFQFKRLCHLGGYCQFIHSKVPFL